MVLHLFKCTVNWLGKARMICPYKKYNFSKIRVFAEPQNREPTSSITLKFIASIAFQYRHQVPADRYTQGLLFLKPQNFQLPKLSIRKCLLTPSHTCSHILTHSHTFPHLIVPSHTFKHILTPSHILLYLLTHSNTF